MSIFGPPVAYGNVLTTCVEPEQSASAGEKRKPVTDPNGQRFIQLNTVTQYPFEENDANNGGVFEIDGRCYQHDYLIYRFSQVMTGTVGGVPLQSGGWSSEVFNGTHTYDNTLPDNRLPVSLAVRAEVFGDAVRDPALPDLYLNAYHADDPVPPKPENYPDDSDSDDSEDEFIALVNTFADQFSPHLVRTSIGHTYEVNCIVFSPNGLFFATGSRDCTVKIWDASTGSCVKMLSHDNSVMCVAFSPHGTTLASGCVDGTLELWNFMTGSLLATKREHSMMIKCLAFSPDGSMIASGSRDNTAIVWDANGEVKVVFHDTLGHESDVNSVAFSPDGRGLITASEDHTAIWWYVPEAIPMNSTGIRMYTFEGHTDDINSMCLSPDGRTVLTASDDCTAKLWNDVGDVLNTLEHEDWVTSAFFSPDGSIIATVCNDKCVRLWDVSPLRLRAVLDKHNERVNDAAFSLDGRIIATCSSDGTIMLWDARTGTLKGGYYHDGPVHHVALSPDGSKIVSGSKFRSGTKVTVWTVLG